MNFKKPQRRLAIKTKFNELRQTHRGFNRRRLWSMAKDYVQHHFSRHVTKD